MAKTAEPEDQAVEQIRGVFSRALKMTERLMTRIEDDAETTCETCGGSRVTIETLLEFQKNVTNWAAKFSASEAPKRLKLEGGAEITHRVISDETVRRLAAFATKHAALGLLEGSIDVEHSGTP